MTLIPISTLQALGYDPLSSKITWCGLTHPITREEVQACIDSNVLQDYLKKTHPLGDSPSREYHAARIAFLVKHGWEDPISIDVGIPHLGCIVNHIVDDGNHRLAAAIFRGDSHIEAEVSGALSYIEELGLC